MSSTTVVRRSAHRVLLGAFAGTDVPAWLPGLVADGLGGICLYGNNLTADPADVVALAQRLSALSPALVIALDEEGGDVTRIDYAGGSPYPGNAVLGRHDDLGTTTAVARAIGTELKGAGVWLDLAPDADVNSQPRNPVIGTRSFGDDPALVARHTAAWVSGLQECGVAACVKHFPGHGDTAVDSHLALPRVDVDLETLRSRELVPFVAAIAAGAACVMTSHIVLSALDPQRPATLSPAILTGLLREELGFDGVIVTDALDMAGASAEIGIPAAAVQSLAAGADLLCIGPSLHGRGSRDVTDVVDAIVEAVESGALPAQRLADAARRVDALAATYGTGVVSPDPAVVEAGLAAGRRAATAVVEQDARDVLRTLPPGRPLVVRVEAGANMAVGEAAWGELGLDAEVRSTFPDPPTVDEVAAHDGPVVVVARAAAADPRAWDWLTRLVDARPDAVLVELGWPTPDVATLPHVVRGWGASLPPSRAAGEVIARALSGAGAPAGEER